MVKAVCPTCEALVEITPTGEKKKEGWSAEWWQIVMHKKPDEPAICAGSGRRL